jgi:8-oxo-dGTP diphosphatase
MTKKKYKSEHIVTSVVAVIVDQHKRVLLTKRSVPPFQDMWVMPGGKIDLGEPMLTALKREVLEEVGLDVEVENLIDVFEHIAPGEENYHFVILYYRCRPLGSELIRNEQEVAEAEWVHHSDLEGYNIAVGASYILDKVFPVFSGN